MNRLYETAKKGNHFVLTEYGYEQTREEIKHERAVGKPVAGFEHEVPPSWVRKGYVKEVKEGVNYGSL